METNKQITGKSNESKTKLMEKQGSSSNVFCTGGKCMPIKQHGEL